MRSNPRLYALSFIHQLPPDTPVSGPTYLDGCGVLVSGCYVTVLGPSRDRVFEQAAVLLRRALKDSPPLSIAAVLSSPDPAGRDSYSIIVGADVAFSPTSLPPHLPVLEHGPAARPPPLLEEIER